MLCEKCKGLKSPTLQGIEFTCRKMGFKERISGHQVNGEWMPGPTPKHLEDWCAKNCKPAKPVELVKKVKEVKEVKEKITPPSPLKDKGVQSSNKNATDKKKD